MSIPNHFLEYIAETYGVPANIGQKVKYEGRPGVICGARNAYIKIHFDGEAKPDKGSYHPTYNIEYIG